MRKTTDNDKLFIQSIIDYTATANYIDEYIEERRNSGKLQTLLDEINIQLITIYATGGNCTKLQDVANKTDLIIIEDEQAKQYKAKYPRRTREDIQADIQAIETEIEQISQEFAEYKTIIDSGNFQQLTDDEKRNIYISRDYNREIKEKEALKRWLRGEIDKQDLQVIQLEKGLAENERKAIEKAKELGYISNVTPPYIWTKQKQQLAYFIESIFDIQKRGADLFSNYNSNNRVNLANAHQREDEMRKFMKPFVNFQIRN